MQTPIKMLLADNQYQYRQAILGLLHNASYIHYCGEAFDGEELIEMTGCTRPDLVIVNLELPLLSGIEATRILRNLYPDLKILGLTDSSRQELIIQMMQAGANGYIIKNAETVELKKAIDTVMNNQPYFCNNTTLLLAAMLSRGIFNTFTTTKLPVDFFAVHEKEILQLICLQYSSKQIAHKIGLAHRSVEKYRHALMQKTGSQNMAGLVLFALRYGIAPPEVLPGKQD
ncbi:response regulator [Terrimonas rubra]|uniref:Response regulator n=1 Tax=Terrimonas rubra TaxID=1035890 RepID=A0ABW6A5J5_9BACT